MSAKEATFIGPRLPDTQHGDKDWAMIIWGEDWPKYQHEIPIIRQIAEKSDLGDDFVNEYMAIVEEGYQP